MGKRKSGKGGLTGLSGFVLSAFKQDEASTSSYVAVEPASTGPVAPTPAPLRTHAEERPIKRQKTQQAQDTSFQVENGDWNYVEKYDATGLVPHYTKATEVPEHLKKYFSQRYRYFSLYSQGCLLDEEGWYSVTPELVADQIAERCRCDTILDAFCGVGGNAIAFAKTCQRVIALDTSPTRLSLARHNAQIYGVADRIEFILADYRFFAKSYLSHTHSGSPNARKIDVVFLSPPWGGPSYLLGTNSDSTSSASGLGQATSTLPTTSSASAPSLPLPIEAHPEYSLSSIQPIPGDELFRLTRQITPNIAYYLPRNTRLSETSNLLNISDEVRETERNPPPANLNATEVELEKQKQKTGEANAGVTGAKDGMEDPNANAAQNMNLDLGLPEQAPGMLTKKEAVEVEEEWMGSKLKALTCYFGGLAAGQEDLY